MKQNLILALFASALMSSCAAGASTKEQVQTVDETVSSSQTPANDVRFSTRTYPLTDFSKIDVGNVVKVIYTQGSTYSVELTGRTDWLDDMYVNATDGKLTVRTADKKKFNNVKKSDKPDGNYTFILRLTAPSLEGINLHGASAFESKQVSSNELCILLSGATQLTIDAAESDKMTIESSGAGQLDFKGIAVREIDVRLSGACKAKFPIAGKAETVKLIASGASELTLGGEISGLMQVNLSGACNSRLKCKGGSLRTLCSGASDVVAEVNCQNVYANCSGASKIKLTGTADHVEIDGSSVTNIDTSRLNQL